MGLSRLIQIIASQSLGPYLRNAPLIEFRLVSFSLFLEQGVVNLLKWYYQHGDHRPHSKDHDWRRSVKLYLVTIFLSANRFDLWNLCITLDLQGLAFLHNLGRNLSYDQVVMSRSFLFCSTWTQTAFSTVAGLCQQKSTLSLTSKCNPINYCIIAH